ncbi:MAG: hypothetical protein MK010_06205, partial [Erythrobacter sp.]|nr:hypothetical protein [Erythrobacter sp.]
MNAHTQFTVPSNDCEDRRVRAPQDDIGSDAPAMSDAMPERETVLSRWFMQRSLTAKARITAFFTLGGAISVTVVGLLALHFPSFALVGETLMLVLAVFASIMGYSALRFIEQRVIAPMEELTTDLIRMSNGERNVRPWHTDRPDTIGDMARALEAFRIANAQLDEHIAARASSEAEREKERVEARRIAERTRRETIDKLLARFESSVGEVVTTVASASTQLQSTAKTMASTLEETSSHTDQVARSMDQARGAAPPPPPPSGEIADCMGVLSPPAAQYAPQAP